MIEGKEELYDLTDHRKDDNFSNWKKDYKKYQKTMNKAKAIIRKKIEDGNNSNEL